MNKSMELLVAAVQELSLARDINTVTGIVRKAARQLTGADGATFILRDRDLCFYADEDAITPLWKGQRFPMSACISGWTMLNRQSVVIEDIYSDNRIPVDAYKPTFVKSLAMVPIRTIDPIGAIGNYWAKNYLPTKEEIHLLQSLADITAVTMENVKVYSELEQRVKDRTKELEFANKDLEAFSYSVSHDLRSPLRTINGYLGMLLEDYSDKFDEEGKRMADRVMNGVKDMGLLIDDLLEFSKMGRKVLEREPIQMRNLVSSICNSMKDQEGNRDIGFTIKEIPDIAGDSSLIKQVWINLISNAVKYTQNKEKTMIEIGSEEREAEIIYYVKDNGAGFDMQYYDKLFGVFQRLHSKKEFDGTGIGLAIVEKIVSKHGGKVWAEGKVNEGAAFYFSFPHIRS